LALQYLTCYLKFEIGDLQLRAIERFHQLAAKYALIDSVHPLRHYGKTP
jgi:hypothetical protein